jgi:hypothetical protein
MAASPPRWHRVNTCSRTAEAWLHAGPGRGILRDAPVDHRSAPRRQRRSSPAAALNVVAARTLKSALEDARRFPRRRLWFEDAGGGADGADLALRRPQTRRSLLLPVASRPAIASTYTWQRPEFLVFWLAAWQDGTGWC